jgi:hypothetical protein
MRDTTSSKIRPKKSIDPVEDEKQKKKIEISMKARNKEKKF